MSKASCQQLSHDEEESSIGKPTKDEPPEHHFNLVVINGLGNGHVFDFELPYNIEYRGFLLRVEWQFGAQSRVKIHNDSDYVNWAKRLAILPQDDTAVARIQQQIAQYKSTDFKALAEWVWVGPECILIDSQDTFGALMGKAKAGELDSEGCFIRVCDAEFHAITTGLRRFELQQDEKAKVQGDDALTRWQEELKVEGVDDPLAVGVVNGFASAANLFDQAIIRLEEELAREDMDDATSAHSSVTQT